MPRKRKYEFKWKEQTHLVKSLKELEELCEQYDFCFDCPLGELCDEHKKEKEFGGTFILAIINRENRKQKLKKLLT